MNIVKSNLTKSTSTTLGEVLKTNETAFIGQCGSGPAHSLYLIAFQRIIQANRPGSTWDISDCSVTVDRYVDVEMIVKEKV